MTLPINRRQALVGGSALLAAATTGLLKPRFAHAADDTITIRTEEDLSNLDPANRTGPIDVNVINAVQQGLIAFKPGSTEWELDAAEDLKQVSDTEISFKLRPGLKFTDGYGDVDRRGREVLLRTFHQAGFRGQEGHLCRRLAGAGPCRVTGPLTGKLVLKNAAPALWVIALADGSGRIISKKAFEKLGEKGIATTLIGSGPYVLKEWKQRDHYTLVANPDYKGPIKSHFKTIIGKPIAEQKTADLAFQAGEIDFTQISPTNVKTFKALPKTTVTEVPAIDYIWFGPNIEAKPFDNVKVRQALRLAVDIDAVLTGAYGGLYPRANALLAPGLIGYWKDAPVYKRDVEAAKKLLEEAGQGGGFKTRLTILSNAENQAVAAIVPGPISRKSESSSRSRRWKPRPIGPWARTTPAPSWNSRWSSIAASSTRASRPNGSPRTRSAPGTGSAGRTRSSTIFMSGAPRRWTRRNARRSTSRPSSFRTSLRPSSGSPTISTPSRARTG